MLQSLPLYEQSCNLCKGKKNAEAMWRKKKKSDSKIWPGKLKVEFNLTLGRGEKLPVAASLKFRMS